MSQENTSDSCRVRIGHSLNEAEKNHVTSRKKSVLQCLLQHGIQCSLDEVPSIALLGSGGGERAMVGLLGSLVQLNKEGLLDCMMYLSGVSGSIWCMTSLYKDPDWPSRLEAVKDDIIQRLVGDGISFIDQVSTLHKCYQKDNFSLTDIWAVLFISVFLKEIDEQTLTDQRSINSKDPYPIYTVIDKHSKEDEQTADIFFEITPHEAGYSVTGAFVDSACFASQFEKGDKIKDQPEMDMLYLQSLCGSVLADKQKILEELLNFIKSMFGHYASSEAKQTEFHSLSAPDTDEIGQVLLMLVELNLQVLKEEDALSQIAVLKDLLRGKLSEEYDILFNLEMVSEEMAKKNIKELTLCVCTWYSDWFQNQNYNGIWSAFVKCIELVIYWTWGTTYNFLHNMTAHEVSPCIMKAEKRHFEDAGIFINSPYFSVLRKERQIDLIISLDFSEGDPFTTVVMAAEKCKELHIPFPDVHITEEDKPEPKDFYVFEGHNAPTVIHIPLFNKTNCEGVDFQTCTYDFRTFQLPYNIEKIHRLLEKAGMNIKNNKENLLRQIQKVIKRKTTNYTLD